MLELVNGKNIDLRLTRNVDFYGLFDLACFYMVRRNPIKKSISVRVLSDPKRPYFELFKGGFGTFVKSKRVENVVTSKVFQIKHTFSV